MCITINCGVWRHGSGTNLTHQIESDELGGFWSKPSVKSWDKNHIKCGYNLWSTVICSTEYAQSDWESTRRSFQSVRSYEEIRGTFNSKGSRRPERPILTMVNGDYSTYLRQRLVYESEQRRSKWWSTSQHLDDIEVVWRQKSTTKLWVRSAACIRSLAKLSLATFSVTEPANWL